MPTLTIVFVYLRNDSDNLSLNLTFFIAEWPVLPQGARNDITLPNLCILPGHAILALGSYSGPHAFFLERLNPFLAK